MAVLNSLRLTAAVSSLLADDAVSLADADVACVAGVSSFGVTNSSSLGGTSSSEDDDDDDDDTDCSSTTSSLLSAGRPSDALVGREPSDIDLNESVSI